nr:splicing factor [Tanacetum cinerariifolium]
MLIADQVFTVNLHHDGIFTASPLRYLQGDLKQITDIDFEGMSFDVFRDIIKHLVHGTVYRLCYWPIRTPLNVGIKELKKDSDVEDFVRVGGGNVVIKNLTTHDPYLNKLCGNNGMFRDYLDVLVLETEAHRKCTRHVYANFKKKYSGLQLQRLFWGATSSTVEELFYAKMDDLKYINLEAYEYMVARNPNSWCRAFFNLNVKCAAFENGISESYHKAILLQRSKPIINMLEDIKIYIMQRLWQLSGVPCIHAVVGYMHLNRDPDEGVHFSYSQKGRGPMGAESGGRGLMGVESGGRGPMGAESGGIGPMGAKSGGRGPIGAESGGRGPMGAESGGRGGMGFGIGAMGTDSGGRGGIGGGKASMGGARGRRGGARGRR